MTKKVATDEKKPGPGQQSLVDDEPVAPLPEDEPPKKTRGRPKGARTKKDKPPRASTGQFASTKTQMREGIAKVYGVAGMAFAISPSLAPIGEACVQNAESIADAWVDVAEQNPAIKRFWESMLQGSATSALVMAHLPILLAGVTARPGALGPLGSMFGGGGRGPSETDASPGASTPPPPPPPPPPRASANGNGGGSDIGTTTPFNPAFGDSVAS